MTYVLPVDNTISVGAERFRCPEVLSSVFLGTVVLTPFHSAIVHKKKTCAQPLESPDCRVQAVLTCSSPSGDAQPALAETNFALPSLALDVLQF